jgi:hypothetical protein
MNGEAVMTQTRTLILPIVVAMLATAGSSAGTSAQDSSLTRNARLTNTVSMSLAQPTRPLPVRPDRPRRVEIDWAQVAVDIRQQSATRTQVLTNANFVPILPRPRNAAAEQVTNTRLPVLMPNLNGLDLSDNPVSMLFPEADFYTFTLTGSDILVEVFGTRLAHADAPDALTARHLRVFDEDGYRVRETAYGRELEFSRYGAAYSVTIECDEPETDPRCSSDEFARRVARALLITAGSPGEGE